MQFSREHTFFRVVRIAGPTHNFLALELASGVVDPQLDELDAPGARNLDPEDVRREASAGVAEAAASLGLSLSIKRLKFVPTDTGPAKIYRDLADALIRHFADDIPQLLASSSRQPTLARRDKMARPSRSGARIRQHEG